MRKSLLILMLLLTPVLVRAQKINDVDVTVRLQKDGTAYIKQVWDVEIVKGTEWYIPIGNLGEMRVDSLRVFEGEREFASDGRKWNSDRSREAKAFRCGIIDKGSKGVELCWGQGEYGPHVWTATFIVRNLVQSYQDADGFNFMFINDELIAGPQHAKVSILNETGSEPWSKENGGIWAFGYDGFVWYEDGVIYAESENPLEYDNSVIVMCRFDKGLFSLTVSCDIPFEQIRDRAFKDSDYKEEEKSPVEEFFVNLLTWLFMALCALLCAGIPLYFLGKVIWQGLLKATGHIYKKSVYGVTKIDGWWRDIPLGGDLTAAYSLLKDGNRFFINNDANLIGAYFLLWIQEGHIKVEPDPKDESRVNLAFDPSDDLILPDSTQVELYNMALEAAGKNHLLEPREFETWAKSHYGRAGAWPDKARSRGGILWKQASEEERRHLIQFKNYLQDFTISDERQAVEVKLWRSYLVYAQLFGIADRVAENFSKLYPDEFRKYVADTGFRNAATMSSVLSSTQRTASAMLLSAYSAKKAASTVYSGSSSSRSSSWSYSGGGGRSSRSGGGGYSGGGHGGVSR